MFLAAFSFSALAEADPVASDDFSYPDGPLPGNSGGSGWTYNWSGSGTNVSGGQAIGVNPSTIGFTQNRGIANPGTTTTLFVSLDLITPSAVASSDSFAVILAAGVNGSNLVIGKGVGESVFAVGNSIFSFPSSIPVLPNTSYHLVGVYDLTNQRVSLWIDPNGSDYYDTSDGTNSADASGLASVGGHMERVVFGGTLQFARVDNLIVWNRPADVGLRSTVPAMPALRDRSLGFLATLLLGAGWTGIRASSVRVDRRHR